MTARNLEFEWQNDDRRVVLMPTDIELSNLTAGGMAVPNAEWTANAEKHFFNSLRDRLAQTNAEVRVSNKGLDQPPTQIKLIKLHEVVGNSLLVFGPGSRLALPTKTNGKWTLGPSARFLKDHYQSDYALFVHIRDSYASGERVAAILVAGLFGVGLQGGVQRGFASLVDLNTGDVVWHNSIVRQQGELRTIDGARETADKLLTGFPG
ncbi:MAG: hypothetical protein JKY27_00645 [Magnetovibrio sp.]|nr:hypothetical protein [Magnetovibrio sp.]